MFLPPTHGPAGLLKGRIPSLLFVFSKTSSRPESVLIVCVFLRQQTVFLLPKVSLLSPASGTLVFPRERGGV